MLTLYYAPGSSSLATHIALLEVDAKFNLHRLSIPDKETRTPEHLERNPAGKVPVLDIDGRPLTEVAATLFYIAKKYPDAKLLAPDSDIERQAHIISWMSFVASGLHPIWRSGLETAMPAYEIADRKLGDNQWAGGNDYSIADIHLFRLFWRAAGHYDLPAGSLANLHRHQAQMMQRAAVQKALEVEQV